MLLAFLDSPAWIDIPSYRSGFPGFPYITQQVHSYAKVQHLGNACASQHSGPDAWKCMYGQYRLPTLQTPYFLVASQYDAYQLANEIGSIPLSSKEKAYADGFAKATRALGKQLADKSGVAVYSWSCFNHMVSVTDKGFNHRTCDPDHHGCCVQGLSGAKRPWLCHV